MGRFGLSFLSKHKAADAWNEEMLVHKSTGEVLIKTASGDVVSYNYNSRRNQHIDALELRAKVLGITGKIYELDLSESNYKLPEVIPNGVNIISDNPTIDINVKRFMMSIDADSYICVENIPSHKFSDANISFTITLRSNGIDMAYVNKTMNTSELQNTIFNVSDYTDAAIDSIQLSGLVSNELSTTDTVRTVFNSILVLLEK